MDNNLEKPIHLIFIPLIFASLLGLLISTPSAHASQIQSPVLNTTKHIQLAYFRVYRVKPGWWYGSPGPSYWYGPQCMRRCIVNQYGTVLRCKMGCY
ncbi:hypothetical protein [Legionella micdadei]|uniref:Uncharacterized protein n=1 Tax=Legionella micdadei TaxID=451 RepID=A0A098GI69_LEGMI|nr:hypothetical protein [Legionella micdadei]ARG97367.1 hypothetical protein B6N58_06650 [Legionella micdadei]ARH00325.1 hypothetical protein B6V88_07770 [Legionella micdadei]KTD28252.1 hypothetical protein Lmic_1363 [Legionella micdadei]NSL16881.1 hypothetical protein [Legionella micdadei]CEG61161.1 exported protein of unknown function [Legionella micdadei]